MGCTGYTDEQRQYTYYMRGRHPCSRHVQNHEFSDRLDVTVAWMKGLEA